MGIAKADILSYSDVAVLINTPQVSPHKHTLKGTNLQSSKSVARDLTTPLRRDEAASSKPQDSQTQRLQTVINQ